MSPQALVLVGGRRTAVWPLVAGMGRDLRESGYVVTVASLYAPSAEVVDVLGVSSLVSLEPGRWAPAGLPLLTAAGADAAGADVVPEATSDLEPTRVAAPAPVTSSSRGAPPPGGVSALRSRARGAAATAKKHTKAFLEARGAWERVRGSATVMQTAQAADIVVAADAVMVRAAWEIGQRVPSPAVVLGPAGVAGALAERTAR